MESFMKLFWMVFGIWDKKQKQGKNDPVKPVKPEAGKDEIDIKSVRFCDSGALASAMIAVKASNLRLNNDEGGVGMDIEDHLWEPNDGHCDGMLVVFWKPDQQWFAARMEWVAIGQTKYYAHDPLLNMYHDDEGNRKPYPNKGDPCGFCIASRDLSKRSNILAGTWPINDDGIWDKTK